MKKKISNVGKALIVGASVLGGYGCLRYLIRKAIKSASTSFLKTLMEDDYTENLWEVATSTARIGLQQVFETNLRATKGRAISRPFGTPKKLPTLDDIMFSPAQFYRFPSDIEDQVSLKVTIGKKAKKPFTIEMPVMIAPMAYGTALSKEAKMALAKASSMANIAFCNGEGPYLPEERELAEIYIYQYHRGDWDKTEEILSCADGIEIQFGQGAIAGVGHVVHSKDIDNTLRSAFKLKKGEDIVAHSRQPGVNNPAQITQLVDYLKRVGGGVPIGVSMTAGKYLEKDLEVICNAGIDYISIDGCEAGTKGSPPILQDDFGIPTVFAINRAAEWLYKSNFNQQVSLIGAGKVRTPGDILKLLALGADAVYIGSIALFAMSHTQVLKSLPFEPPNQIIWYEGKQADKFNMEEGAMALKRFLEACREELAIGIRALGKLNIAEVSKDDLVSLSQTISKGCNIPTAYHSCYQTDLHLKKLKIKRI